MSALWRKGVAGILLALGLLGAAGAGQDCERPAPTVAAVARNLELAAAVARTLDDSGLRVAVIARAGQDLSAYRLRWSHLGLIYRDEAANGGQGAWRVVHKLNACGTDRADVHRQGLAEFFSDGLVAHEAGVVPLAPALQATLPALLADDGRLARLHTPRYNMVAYPWAGPYQQSNQWAIETLAHLLDPAVDSRGGARAWLRAHGYRGALLEIPAHRRLGARLALAHVHFDDHPLAARMAGRIETVTADSVFAWLARSGLGGPARIVRAPSAAPPAAPEARAI